MFALCGAQVVFLRFHVEIQKKWQHNMQHAAFCSYSQKLRSKLDGALQDQSRIVLTQLLRYPGMGLS